jgi:hypothetical protein
MSARTAIRAALALVLGSLALPALTSPGSAGQAPPPVAVATRTICPGDQFEITIANPGTSIYQVTITTVRTSGPEVTSVTIDPGETEQVVLAISGTPMDVTIDGDLDFPDQQVGPLFRCPQLVEVVLTTTVDTPVEFVDPCVNTFSFEMPHGRVEPVAGSIPALLRYIPDPGFVGVDDHTINCISSAERDARIVVTVSPAQAPPADPVPEAPTFTG